MVAQSLAIIWHAVKNCLISKQRVKLTGGLMEKEIIEQFQVARLSRRSGSGLLG